MCKSALLALALLWSTPAFARDVTVPALQVSVDGLAIGAKKALHVGLQIAAAAEAATFSGVPSTPGKTDNSQEIGWNVNATFPIGRLLKNGSEAALSKAFDKVTLLGTGAYPADVEAVVAPKVAQFQYWFKGGVYARATVRITVLDKSGVQLWSKEVQTPDMPGIAFKSSMSSMTQALGQAAAQAIGLALVAGIEEMVSAPEVASLWGAGPRRPPAVVSAGQPAATCSSATANIAVLDLLGSGPSRDELLSLTNRLCSELFKTGCYTVLERSEMNGILKEQAFQQSGCTSTECMVEAGRLLSVRYMVGGNVGRVGELYSLDLRMIDVGSGKITAIASQDVSGGIEQVVTVGLRECVAALVRGRK